MADELKVLKVVCKHCSQPMEVPVPDYYVRVVKEKCVCGMSSDARTVRYLMFGVTAIMACILGCCAVGHHYNTEAIRALGESGYKVRPVTPQERSPNGVDFVVEKIVNPQPEPPPRGPIDPRATPHPPKGEK